MSDASNNPAPTTPESLALYWRRLAAEFSKQENAGDEFNRVLANNLKRSYSICADAVSGILPPESQQRAPTHPECVALFRERAEKWRADVAKDPERNEAKQTIADAVADVYAQNATLLAAAIATAN
jgi:hypothetical protein